MSIKVSSILYRITRFNNYKNIWTIKHNQIVKNLLYTCILLNQLFKNFYLNIQFNYFNHNNIKILGQLTKNKIKNKLYNKLIFLYYYKTNFNTLNIYINFYQIISDLTKIQFLKLFLKINLLKGISIKSIYQQLYNILLNIYNKNQLVFCSIKIIVSGRFEGEELTNVYVFKFGTLALQHIDIYIDYEQFSITTRYGLVGIKIWVGKFI